MSVTKSFERLISGESSNPFMDLCDSIRKRSNFSVQRSDDLIDMIKIFLDFMDGYGAARHLLPNLRNRTIATAIHHILDDPKDHPFSPHHHYVYKNGTVNTALHTHSAAALLARIWNFKVSGLDFGYCSFLLNPNGQAYYMGLKLSADQIFENPLLIEDHLRKLMHAIYRSDIYTKIDRRYDNLSQVEDGPLRDLIVEDSLIYLDKNKRVLYNGKTGAVTIKTGRKTSVTIEGLLDLLKSLKYDLALLRLLVKEAIEG